MNTVPVHVLFFRAFYKIFEVFCSGLTLLITLMANVLSLTINVNRCSKNPATVESPNTPTSVNYHFTRKCNCKCGFCFHTAKTSFVLPMEEAKRGLRMLKDSGKALVRRPEIRVIRELDNQLAFRATMITIDTNAQ